MIRVLVSYFSRDWCWDSRHPHCDSSSRESEFVASMGTRICVADAHPNTPKIKVKNLKTNTRAKEVIKFSPLVTEINVTSVTSVLVLCHALFKTSYISVNKAENNVPVLWICVLGRSLALPSNGHCLFLAFLLLFL